MEDLLLAHLVRDDQQQAVALAGRDQRQPQTGVARGGLNQCRARLDPSVALRGFDHVEPDAVLDGTTGILALQLQEQLARSGVKAGSCDQRGIADQRQDIRIGLESHEVSPHTAVP